MVLELYHKKSSDSQNNDSACSGNPLPGNPSWEDLIRHERTAGGLAVMGTTGETVEGDSVGFHPESPTTTAIPQTSLTSTRIVGFSKLKKLLQPIHGWFKNKKAYIQLFRLYDDAEGRTLVYPKIKTVDRDNPYRRYQLNVKASARTYKRMKQFVENRKLDDFQVCSLILTMPKFMSEYLADCGESGRLMAWRLFDGVWSEDLPGIIGQNIELGCHSNLHLWRTEKPTDPHFHFHCLIPNYGLIAMHVKDVPNEDEGDDEAFELKRWNWHSQRGGKVVPFSDEQLEKIKKCWHDRLARFCKRHGLEWHEQAVNVWTEYIDSWQKLHHRFNYNGRHWTEDYAKYSNDNIDCQEPPVWLQHYENKARVRGWWSNLKNITTESDEKEKISPYTGENMGYKDTNDGITVESLVKYAGGSLGYVEFVKGHPFEGDMSENDIEWLKGVMIYSPVDDLDLDTT